MIRFMHFLTGVCLASVLSTVVQCSWPYSPEQEPLPVATDSSQTVAGGTIYSINVNSQTCNPSISQDLVNYPGCMLWLGFKTLTVKVPQSMAGGYTLTKIDQHDRLTVTDTSNTVRWYVMNSDLGLPGRQLQDPEWSNHPDYISFLGQDAGNKWDGYAIRLSDKKALKFCEDGMDELSTPFVWLPDSATGGDTLSAPTYDAVTGFVDKSSVEQFFGTTNVKIAYSLPVNGLAVFYIDYNDSIPKPRQLQKPAGREIWDCESPLISPEGNWVTFNAFPDARINESYIQRLNAHAEPVLVAEKAFDPHWWVDPNDNSYFIIFVTVARTQVIDDDFNDPSVEKNASAGTTVKVRLRGSPLDVPSHMGLRVAESETIIRLPFKGGLSPDGRFLCTGQTYTYMFRFN